MYKDLLKKPEDDPKNLNQVTALGLRH